MSKRRPSAICPHCKNVFEPSSFCVFYCSIECRFWAKMQILGLDDCWEWVASKFHDGYGQFKYKESMVSAPRMAWQLTYSPIPDNLCVLHTCDTPGCCNPTHLFLGTKADNSIDMAKKGRQHQQKLTIQQVKEIKHELAERVCHRILAKKYEIARQTITNINTGHTWSHVTI